MLDEIIIKEIKNELKISEKQIITVLNLLSEGNTIPFIARYRQEMTGNLDEEQINEINKYYIYEVNLKERKEDVIRLIDEKGMLTDELKKEILQAKKLVEVEDLYRPFKEKKKTKATEAIKKGLEPLAIWMMSFPQTPVIDEALKYLNEEVKTPEEAILGAQHIISERISDEAKYRKYLRMFLFNFGVVTANIKKDGAILDPNKVYEMYYEFQEPINKIRPHRVLALNRAEKEKVLNVKLEVETEDMLKYLHREVILDEYSSVVPYIEEAIADSLKRLIYPSLEREIRSELTEKAEKQAITVFGENLIKLLLQPPLKGKVILGLDPAFRTGCKLSVINEQGEFLAKDVIYPHERSKGDTVSEAQLHQAKKKTLELINKYNVDVIAIGNGTASRESETFISSLIKENQLKCAYIIVNEAGASVYSASEVAREEFPSFSVEERSAVSIARRLQDPLSELVKIDPKAIGVGQYQHDVKQKELDEQLLFVVTNAVNNVGVNLNTASTSLLRYVSGLNKRHADNIVKYRQKNLKFKSREELKKVPSLGDKAFEQAIGFLRIIDGSEPLDMTSIHPESYGFARKIMEKYHITPEMFGKDELKVVIDNLDTHEIMTELKIDTYTLNNILDAFVSPMRDPRDDLPKPILKSDVLTLEDLREGMLLEGTVRNVTDFGAFVDIGLKNDGLVHISKMAKRFIAHPKEVVSVGDIVKVYVLKVELDKGRVSLSMIKD